MLFSMLPLRPPRVAELYAASLALLLALPGALAAQSIITITPQQCVWRAGDDPAWAAPTLDESGWKPYTKWQLLPDVPHIWFRCHADLGLIRGAAHPAIQVALQAAYQLFANGSRIGGAGNMRSGFFSMNTIRQYSLPAAALQNQQGIIAWRITTRQPLNSTNPLEIHAGDMEALAGRRASFVLAQSSSVLRVAFWYPLIGVAGLMLLGLFYYDRSRTELLYLSLWCADRAALGIRAYCGSALMNYPLGLDLATLAAVNLADSIVFVLFNFALARRRVPRLYWAPVAVSVGAGFLEGVSLALPAGQSVQLAGVLNTLTVNLSRSIALLGVSTAPFVAFWPYRQISPRIRPMAVLCMLLGGFLFFWTAVQITGYPQLRLPNLMAHWSRVLLEILAFLTASVLVALLALLFRDQRQVTEERALLAGEMQAASEIQRMLAPAKLDTTPGLQIDVAFHPMREVGGDFYGCRILPGNRQRILIGDVSGKGAAAAMTAAVLVGAAQQNDSHSPVALLRHLNLVMLDMRLGGFATCLCAELAADGALTVANAGHLAPYRNGHEVTIQNGLPLGISPQAEYTETSFQLASGDSLTFISDGIVEARNAAGELFGFDRTAAIAHQTAESIASTAQRFGQEDDITVLTVMRLAVDRAAQARAAIPAAEPA